MPMRLWPRFYGNAESNCALLSRAEAQCSYLYSATVRMQKLVPTHQNREES